MTDISLKIVNSVKRTFPRRMSVPKVTSCCYWISLRFGSLLIGYLCAIISLAELFIYATLVTLAQLTTHKLVFFILSAGVSFAQLFGAVLLIIGTTKNRASLTLPWTITTALVVTVHLLLGVTGVTLYVQDMQSMDPDKLIVIVIYFVRACVLIYFIIVVHSRHKEIMTQKQQERFQMSAIKYSPVLPAYS